MKNIFLPKKALAITNATDTIRCNDVIGQEMVFKSFQLVSQKNNIYSYTSCEDKDLTLEINRNTQLYTIQEPAKNINFQAGYSMFGNRIYFFTKDPQRLPIGKFFNDVSLAKERVENAVAKEASGEIAFFHGAGL